MKPEKKNARIGLRSPNLRRTIWIYFAIFIASVLVMMWMLFVASLGVNYKAMKAAQFNGAAEQIRKGLSEGMLTSQTLDELAYNSDMCVLIQNRYGDMVYTFDMMAGKCLIHNTNTFALLGYRQNAIDSPNKVYYAEIPNRRFNVTTMLYVTTIGNPDDPEGFLFLNTSLEPLESSERIIKTQVLLIGILLLILGIGISYILATLIEAPIKRIIKSAEILGKGDYNVKFDGKGYAETEILAETLEYTAGEIAKVDTLKRDLIANVSHDLRTPLTMIKAYAEMVRDLSGDNPKKRNEHINVIIEESDRLSGLVNDLLDLSKLESGASELKLKEFDLCEHIVNIMGRYKLLAENNGYKFYVSLPRKFVIKADIIKIDQVLYNLINNAVNYTGEGKEVYICLIPNGSTARLEITDTGRGIKEEDMKTIFDRYYRTEKAKREVIGSGLGLSIVKEVMKLHGYDYGVMSEVGVGSTFWIEVKCSPPHD
ncbi:MAG: sensor histidine kinase [Ruminococcus sp.]|jgi:signal transduction histidine kinase|nr:sensor histidine kinase [Ruminococcus sp.]